MLPMARRRLRKMECAGGAPNFRYGHTPDSHGNCGSISIDSVDQADRLEGISSRYWTLPEKWLQGYQLWEFDSPALRSNCNRIGLDILLHSM
jgi:hypothetical protein